jgi:hypothetical protein
MACRHGHACVIEGLFLDLNAPLPDNPRLFRFPGSSVVERRTVNPLVGGSNPSRGASTISHLRFFPENLVRYSRVMQLRARLPI